MKNVLKKLIAVVLAVTTLTMLFCLNSNAAELYNCDYYSGNSITMYAKLNTTSVSSPNPSLRASIKINSISTYNFAVFSCGVIGLYNGTNILYNSYGTLTTAYNSKLFGDNMFSLSQNTALHARNVTETGIDASFGGIVYAAGKQSSSYSSTYNNRYVEIDPVTSLPVYTTFFSNISGDCAVVAWQY